VPSVDELWIVRLREHLSRKKPVSKVTSSIVLPVKPLEPDLPLASSSTGSIAGSWERIEVYRSRAERGEALFHPNDCKLIAVRSSHSHVG
jgi:hypothetical protein